MFKCNVINCGNGKCIHKLLDERCPHCNYRMVEVTTTGFKFCLNPNYMYDCDYEIDPTSEDLKHPNITSNAHKVRRGGWYWVRKENIDGQYDDWTPAFWNSCLKKFYSAFFSGIPDSGVIVGEELNHGD